MKASGSGRFEQFFIFHMIRGDFFLLLLLLAAAELGIRYAALLHESAPASRRAWTGLRSRWPRT